MSGGSASRLAGIAGKFGLKLPNLKLVELGVLERELHLPDGNTVHQRIIASSATAVKLIQSQDPEDEGWTLTGKAPGAKLTHEDASEPVFIVLAVSSVEQARKLTSANTEDESDTD